MIQFPQTDIQYLCHLLSDKQSLEIAHTIFEENQCCPPYPGNSSKHILPRTHRDNLTISQVIKQSKYYTYRFYHICIFYIRFYFTSKMCPYFRNIFINHIKKYAIKFISIFLEITILPFISYYRILE